MTPLRFDSMEFQRAPEYGKATVTITADLAVVLEVLRRSGNSLGQPGDLVRHGKPVRSIVTCPMEVGEDDDHQ